MGGWVMALAMVMVHEIGTVSDGVDCTRAMVTVMNYAASLCFLLCLLLGRLGYEYTWVSAGRRGYRESNCDATS